MCVQNIKTMVFPLTGFELKSTDEIITLSPGDVATLPCHLSPKANALHMEIRWFKGTQCIFLYSNGQETEGPGYKGKVSVNTKALLVGDVSLKMKRTRETDMGPYTCQVISGEHKASARVQLVYRNSSEMFINPFIREETREERYAMKNSVQTLGWCCWGGAQLGRGQQETPSWALTHTSTETQHSESRQGEVAGRRVTVVDTPDWFCSGLSEKDMRQDVGLCVRLSAPGPHAFLLVIPVEPSEGEERRMLEKMEDIFGEGCWGHTLILFTHAEGLRERSVEELLQTGSQELQQLVEKCGNRCHLLNIKDRPDDTNITQLLEKIEEMVSGNRERIYSSET
ncbi:hypothetical protein AALO_G00035900 [Alosa alosa]|uniref:Uncharacterized protein n=1 Tax=Alosa alosa TaxID=278164 RepID=A0AAV6H6S8_9TELE|nr:hypothetical protein AALO_G00035900 [Alosa alosa]